jgi:hypothetical protein
VLHDLQDRQAYGSLTIIMLHFSDIWDTILKVLKLSNDLIGAVVLLFFLILKSLYSSKRLNRTNRDNRI